MGELVTTVGATSAVVQLGHGRGFILLVGERRYVIAAAHCIFDKLPEPMPARDTHEVTHKNLIGPLGGKRNVTAQCVFLDPIADIAVFGTPDTQDRYKEARAYEELTGEAAFKIGKLPHQKSARKWPPPSSEAYMLSLDGEWFPCRVMCPGDSLWFEQAAQPVIGGMSGSPIVLPDGSAVGVVSTSESSHSGGREGGPNPMLAANLPGWLLQRDRMSP
jgi:hypothetical protein